METASKVTSPACRHLGLADNPFAHLDNSTGDHRCYLWMQRDRIDLDHQKGYCLSGRYRECPWLQISLPCQQGVKKVWQETVVCAITDTGRRVWPRLVDSAQAILSILATQLRALALSAGENLPKVLGWLRRELPPVGRAMGKGVMTGTRHLGRRLLESRRVSDGRPVLVAAAAPKNEDFEALMRLGLDASRAGRRKQAHLCFSRAAALAPDSEDAWLWTAATTEDSEEALACLEKALAINPNSGRARTQLVDVPQPAPRAARTRKPPRTVSTAPALLQKGIAALDAGNEDEAYQLFVSATEANKASEEAWFWRAKTSTDLGEVISALERVLQLNPRNEKAGASLEWAKSRQRVNSGRAIALSVHESKPIIPALYTEAAPSPRPFLLQLASTAYMVLGVLWVGPVVLPSLDASIGSIYRKIGILPTLQMPYVSSSRIISDAPFPEFNLLYLVPVLVAALSFVAMEIVWSENRAVSLYLAMAVSLSIVAISVLGADQAHSIPLILVSAVAGLSAMGGRIIYQKRTRSRLASRASSSMAGLAKTV